MQRKECSNLKTRICYVLDGRGPAVVLLHGFGEDSSIWIHQQRVLCHQFKVIIPDLPGSGCSELMDVTGMQGAAVLEEYAVCIKKILDEEKIDQCTIIGHSMGGYVALAFSHRYPESLNGLGLFHSTAFADSEEKKSIRRKGIEFIQRYGAQKFLQQSIPNLFGEAFTQAHPEQIEKLISGSANFTAEALVQYYQAMMNRPDRSDCLKRIDIPVLFIIGEEDKSVYLQESLKQCYLPARSFINILPETAHMGMWEQKDQANDTVLKFLNYVRDA